MTAPTPYNRLFSFTNYQTTNPASPLPGNEADAELNAVVVSIASIIADLALIQRSDGQLANQSVGYQQLQAAIQTGINPPTQWSGASVSYGVGDTVFSGLLFYVCNTANVSNGSAPPSGNASWTLLADFSGVTVPPGSITSAAFAAGAVTSAALASGLALPASPASGDDSTAIATTAFVQGAISSIAGLPPIGAGALWFTSSPPTGWLICNGQAVSRTTYASLFALLGTTYGSGDGSTTFNIPNLAGAAPVGVGGSDSVTLNQSFGANEVTLTVSNLASHTHVDNGHTHAITDPGHAHAITDPGHTHPASTAISPGTGAGAGVNINPTGTSTESATTGISIDSHTTGVTVNSGTANLANTGTGTPFSIYQPSLGVNFIIRAL